MTPLVLALARVPPRVLVQAGMRALAVVVVHGQVVWMTLRLSTCRRKTSTNSCGACSCSWSYVRSRSVAARGWQTNVLGVVCRRRDASWTAVMTTTLTMPLWTTTRRWTPARKRTPTWKRRTSARKLAFD